MYDLKPCPWPECRNRGAISLEKAFLDSGYYIFCSVCEATGPCAQTEEEAVRLWNTMQRQEEQDD